MALVVAASGGWGTVATTGGAHDAPLPNCLARLIQNKHQVLVDALPYLDKEYDKPNMRDLVDSMIDEEMDQFEPDDYIASLPPVPAPSFTEGGILAQEYQRLVADPSSRLSAVDVSRYQPRAPSGKDAGSSAAWEVAVQRAQTLQEHTGMRLVNDDLLQQYGVNSWRAFNSGCEDTIDLYKKEVELQKLKVLDINRKRMAAQITIESKLRKLEDRYEQAVAKNMRIEAECVALEKSMPALAEASV